MGSCATKYNNGYADGFEVGMKWDKNYRPAGPWVCGVRKINSAKQLETARKSRQYHVDWHEGFDAALIMRGIPVSNFE